MNALSLYRDPSLPIETRLRDLLARMTLPENAPINVTARSLYDSF